jgi:hypothetical protein
VSPTLLLLALTAQLEDLATFGLVVRAQGIGGEIGPLRLLYAVGGFDAVALAKCAAIGVIVWMLGRLSARHQRPLALLVALLGVFGAATNVWALV